MARRLFLAIARVFGTPDRIRTCGLLLRKQTHTTECEVFGTATKNGPLPDPTLETLSVLHAPLRRAHYRLEPERSGPQRDLVAEPVEQLRHLHPVHPRDHALPLRRLLVV